MPRVRMSTVCTCHLCKAASKQEQFALSQETTVKCTRCELQPASVCVLPAVPFKPEHFDPDQWAAQGYDRGDAQQMLSATKAALGHPNPVTELRFPGCIDVM